jgi:hypothetical protein
MELCVVLPEPVGRVSCQESKTISVQKMQTAQKDIYANSMHRVCAKEAKEPIAKRVMIAIWLLLAWIVSATEVLAVILLHFRSCGRENLAKIPTIAKRTIAFGQRPLVQP